MGGRDGRDVVEAHGKNMSIHLVKDMPPISQFSRHRMTSGFALEMKIHWSSCSKVLEQKLKLTWLQRRNIEPNQLLKISYLPGRGRRCSLHP